MEQNLQSKWQGKVSTRLTKASADQIWPLFTDFFNLHKYFASLATCYGVSGTNGEPGCIRYCEGFSIPNSSAGSSSSTDDNKRPVVGSWAKERLLALDHVHRCLSYDMVDSNIGFKSYVSTVKIFPGDQDHNLDDGRNGGGCVIEWSFTVDPVEGLGLDELVQKYESGLHRMAQRMEDSILQAQFSI